MKKQLLKGHEQLNDLEWLAVVQYYQTHTARETAAHFGLEYKQGLVTALARAYPKNAGHGGARPNSGNASEDRKTAKATVDAIQQAKAYMALNALPDSSEINQENASEMAREAANVLRGTVAELRGIIAKLAAIAGVVALILYLI